MAASSRSQLCIEEELLVGIQRVNVESLFQPTPFPWQQLRVVKSETVKSLGAGRLPATRLGSLLPVPPAGRTPPVQLTYIPTSFACPWGHGPGQGPLRCLTTVCSLRPTNQLDSTFPYYVLNSNWGQSLEAWGEWGKVKNTWCGLF